jgi:hypothetical protein
MIPKNENEKEVLRRLERIERKVFRGKTHDEAYGLSPNLIGDFLKQHPEVKTSSDAKSKLLEKGIGRVEDLERFSTYDFGSNTSNGLEPERKDQGQDITS